MGHHLSAVLLRGPFNKERALAFGLQAIALAPEITLFPVSAAYTDHWADRLGVHGFVSDRPLLNSRVVHHLIRQIAPEPLFAVIETDYFGGMGDQAAAVYCGAGEVMAPAAASLGPINEALRHLGVRTVAGRDEFDSVGLGRYRHFDDWFDIADA